MRGRQNAAPEKAGHPGTVYLMSARTALRGGDADFTVFEADFTEYLASRRKSDLRASAVAQARRIASALLDEVMLTRRAAEMRAGDAAGRVEQFSARLAEVAVHSRDAVIIVDGESGRLLFALNDAADQDRPRVCREITEQLDALLNGDLRAAAPAEIERRGGERLAALTVTAAEAWRQRQRQAIEQGLAQVDARLAAGLKAELRRPQARRRRATRPRPRRPRAQRPAGRKPQVLLQHYGGRRPDRAAGRRGAPLASR